MTIEIRLWNEETMEYELNSSHEERTLGFITSDLPKMKLDRVSYFEHSNKIIVWGTAVRP